MTGRWLDRPKTLGGKPLLIAASGRDSVAGLLLLRGAWSSRGWSSDLNRAVPARSVGNSVGANGW